MDNLRTTKTDSLYPYATLPNLTQLSVSET
jgi:hypothetical protein